MQTLSDTAHSLVASGFSIIPIRVDGSKAPSLRSSWDAYKERQPTKKEIASWFRTPKGFGIVCGSISGNLEVIDIDRGDLAQKFFSACIKEGAGDLLEKLVHVQTPKPGMHLIYRCPEIEGNQKLARYPNPDKESKQKWLTAIETRGEGGYIVGAGSPKECHPNNKEYEVINGSLDAVPDITVKERNLLIRVARSFDEFTEASKPSEATWFGTGSSDLRPGDDYNERADWEELLTSLGWKKKRTKGVESFWMRPGKTDGAHGGTLNYEGSNLFHVFSSNAYPFEPNQTYNKFEVFTLHFHNGDHSAAARALSLKGYGAARQRVRLNGNQPPKVDGVVATVNEMRMSEQRGQPTPEEAAPVATHWRGHGQKKDPDRDLGLGLPTEWQEPIFIGLSGDAVEAEDLLASFHPSPIKEFVEALAWGTQTPVSLASSLVLAVIATACQKKVLVSPSDYSQWIEPVNIWIAAAAPSGSRKSPVFSKSLAPVVSWEKARAEVLKPLIAAQKAKHSVAQQRIATLSKKAASTEDPEMRESMVSEIGKLTEELKNELKYPQLWTQDVTPEQLQNLLVDHFEKMSLMSDEGGIFEVMAGLYNRGRANIDVFLQAFSGTAVRVDRAGRQVLLEAPALTFGLTVQPDVISELSKGDKKRFRGVGALARFLYVMPKSNLGTRDFSRHLEMPAEIENRYNHAIGELLQLNPDKPVKLYLSEDARASFTQFGAWIEKQLGEDGALKPIQDWASKLAGQALRIAALWHMVKCATELGVYEHTRMIDKETMENALDFTERLISHARLAFDIMGDGDQAVRDAREIYEWILRRNEWYFTLRDLRRLSMFNKSKRDAVDNALEVLIDRDIISTLRLRKKPGGTGRPFRVHYVNPAVVSWPEEVNG